MNKGKGIKDLFEIITFSFLPPNETSSRISACLHLFFGSSCPSPAQWKWRKDPSWLGHPNSSFDKHEPAGCWSTAFLNCCDQGHCDRNLKYFKLCSVKGVLSLALAFKIFAIANCWINSFGQWNLPAPWWPGSSHLPSGRSWRDEPGVEEHLPAGEEQVWSGLWQGRNTVL